MTSASGGDREGERERSAVDVSKQAADIKTGAVKQLLVVSLKIRKK